MARYNNFKYGQEKYGEQAAQAYSVEPFIAYAVDYQKVRLTHSRPSGVFSLVKIVRNQYAYSQTQTDGVTIWESTSLPAETIDTNQLASGRFAFYSIWLQLADSSWVLVGEAEVLVPSKHSSRIYPKYIDETNTPVPADILLQTTHERFLNYIPKIFTASQAITDNQNTNNDLSLFLEGFSFTVDEFLTYTQLVLPGLSGKYSNAGILKLQGDQLGVPEDTQGLTKTQKYLVRDSIYIYSRKGTAAGLNRFVKAITGYVPTITVSSNMLLSIQDSTFYNGVGNWKGSVGVVLSALNTTDVPTIGSSDLVVDNSWILKVDTTAAVSPYPEVYLGSDDPILTGVPVTAGVEYTFSYWIKKGSSSGDIYGQSIKWFDQDGERVVDSPAFTSSTITTSWVRKTWTVTAPSKAVFASVSINFSQTSGTYYIDRAQLAVSSEANYSEARAIKIAVASDAATRLTKIPRLNFEITKYLPINKAYFITSSSGFESSGISS